MSKIKTFFPLTIDSTMLAAFNACESKGFRQYIQHLNGPESTDLIAGKAFARGLEVARRNFYDKKFSENQAIASGIVALVEEYGDHDPRNVNKSSDKMCMALESYFMEYPLGRDHATPALLADGTRAIEYSFAHELPFKHPVTGQPLLFVGRADALVEYGGKLWVQDEKTTSQITESWASQWETRGQFTAYCWGLRKDGIPVAGALIRGIGIYKTQFKHIETTTNRSEFEIKCWENMMLATVGRMIDCYLRYTTRLGTPTNEIFLPAFNETCYSYFRACQFTDLCKSAHGERFLETEYDQYIWLPHRHERVLLEAFLQELIENGTITQEQYDAL